MVLKIVRTRKTKICVWLLKHGKIYSYGTIFNNWCVLEEKKRLQTEWSLCKSCCKAAFLVFEDFVFGVAAKVHEDGLHEALHVGDVFVV